MEQKQNFVGTNLSSTKTVRKLFKTQHMQNKLFKFILLHKSSKVEGFACTNYQNLTPAKFNIKFLPNSKGVNL